MRSSTYTYQGGKRLDLSCSTTHFIARSTKDVLISHEFKPVHEASAHSWSVETTAERLADDLRRGRRVGWQGRGGRGGQEGWGRRGLRPPRSNLGGGKSRQGGGRAGGRASAPRNFGGGR